MEGRCETAKKVKFFYCRSLSSPILFDDAIISFLTGIVQKKSCRTFNKTLLLPYVCTSTIQQLLLQNCDDDVITFAHQNTFLCKRIQSIQVSVSLRRYPQVSQFLKKNTYIQTDSFYDIHFVFFQRSVTKLKYSCLLSGSSANESMKLSRDRGSISNRASSVRHNI